MAEEKLEQITVSIPQHQVNWLRARAYRHSRSLAAEVRSIVHFADQAEALLGKTDVVYVNVPPPAEQVTA